MEPAILLQSDMFERTDVKGLVMEPAISLQSDMFERTVVKGLVCLTSKVVFRCREHLHLYAARPCDC